MSAKCPIGEPLPPPETIKPRKRAPHDSRTVLAVDPGVAVCTEDGEQVDWQTFIERLPSFGPAIVVVGDAFETLVELDAYWSHHSQWQWTLYPESREWEDQDRSYAPPAVARFGFMRYGQSRRARYFQVLCPARFSEAAGSMLEDASLADLVRFGVAVRDWCNEQGMSARSSAASIGTAMLTDPRFKATPRRKVPAATNCRAREQLPGNHYRLAGSPAKAYPKVRKIDLSAAHHRAALQVQFPDPKTLRAKGRWRLELPTDGEPATDWAERPWAWRDPGRHFRQMIQEHGLFLVVLRAPARARAPHPALAKVGTTYRYVWSSELESLRRAGAKILAIVAQWTSPDTCEQLNEYAMWAIGELERRPDLREWLKPALLATYGVLAAKPRRFRVAYRQAKGGRDIAFPTRTGGVLEGWQYRTAPREPRTANVIARGLIEANVRVRVIDTAMKLQDRGERILEVWADSIFMEGDGPVNLNLEPAWRDEGVLTNVRFYDSTHVVADGFVRLPGVTGDRRDQLASLEYRHRQQNPH